MNEHIQETKQFDTMREDSFMKKLLKKRLNQKGLTLIELLAVIVILAIVAAIAIPAIGNLIENSRIKAAKSDAVLIINAANLYKTEGNTLSTNSAAGTTLTSPSALSNYIDGIENFSADTYVYLDTSEDIRINGTWSSGGVTVDFTGASLAEINPEDANNDPETGTATVTVQ